jgi:hypothetical protein
MRMRMRMRTRKKKRKEKKKKQLQGSAQEEKYDIRELPMSGACHLWVPYMYLAFNDDVFASSSYS